METKNNVIDEQLNVNSSEITSGAVATAKVDSPTSTEAYPMDIETFEVKVNIFPTLEKPHYVTHVLRKPTFDEEEARERKTPLITSDAGKIDGHDASSMTMDDEPANIALYDKICSGVKGYALKQGEKPTDELVTLDTVVNTKQGDKTVRELIPSSHKNTAVNGMYPKVDFTIDVDEEDFTFALGGGREWTVKQEIGGKHKQEDGTLSDPDYTVSYVFREPTEAERKTFRSNAISAINLRTATGVKERRSTNLRVLRELFDKLIISVENASIEGKDLDVTDKNHLGKIPGTFKKSAVIKVFNFLEADLSN